MKGKLLAIPGFLLIVTAVLIIVFFNKYSGRQVSNPVDRYSLTSGSQTKEVLGDEVDGHNPDVNGIEYKPYYSLQDLRVDSKIDSSVCYEINSKCAVAVIPDTSWINEQQRSMPEDDWNTIVSDNQYYQSLATDTLESYGIKVFYRFTDFRYLRFVKNNGREFTVDRAKKQDLWGLILFNGIDDPVLWNDVGIGKAMKEIYRDINKN